MKLLYGQSREIGDWTARHILGCERGWDEFQAVGVLDHRGMVVAGVVFHNWSPEAEVIEVSAAATDPRWARPAILTELFAYPFDLMGCRMVVARISEDNTRARKLWRAFGAHEYVIPDLRGDGVAECLMTLKASDWKKSRLYHGQAKATQAA